MDVGILTKINKNYIYAKLQIYLPFSLIKIRLLKFSNDDKLMGVFFCVCRKSGFEALQKKEQEKREMAKSMEKQKYGSWGSTFKNRDHFISMHHC